MEVANGWVCVRMCDGCADTAGSLTSSALHGNLGSLLHRRLSDSPRIQDHGSHLYCSTGAPISSNGNFSGQPHALTGTVVILCERWGDSIRALHVQPTVLEGVSVDAEIRMIAARIMYLLALLS